MFYRVNTTLIYPGIKIDGDGNLIASPMRLIKLAEMGLPDTPPVLVGTNPDGTYNIHRDFDTLEQAQSWKIYYESLPTLVIQDIQEVEQKEVGAYIGEYQYLTDEEKLVLWNDTYAADRGFNTI
jgi:mannosyltransferase OCH1-like enzyme